MLKMSGYYPFLAVRIDNVIRVLVPAAVIHALCGKRLVEPKLLDAARLFNGSFALIVLKKSEKKRLSGETT